MKDKEASRTCRAKPIAVAAIGADAGDAADLYHCRADAHLAVGDPQARDGLVVFY
jgi:hypothetical protein